TYVEEHPLSAFAETLRSAKIAIDIGRGLPAPGNASRIAGINERRIVEVIFNQRHDTERLDIEHVTDIVAGAEEPIPE
ncbi:hypothetical protein ACC709_37285, partial [Rhizobium ruizarguesonis]